jgi:hypothetical protein
VYLCNAFSSKFFFGAGGIFFLCPRISSSPTNLVTTRVHKNLTDSPAPRFLQIDRFLLNSFNFVEKSAKLRFKNRNPRPPVFYWGTNSWTWSLLSSAREHVNVSAGRCGFVDLLVEKASRTSVESSPVELNHACFLFSDKLKLCTRACEHACVNTASGSQTGT